MSAQGEAGRLGLVEKLGYGVGDTASHFVWDMVGFWLLVFYTDTLGISPAAAGTILLIARVWDMITDPVMGVIADRTRTRWGKFRPYILYMAVPYGALAVAAFTVPDLGPTGKVVWAGATYMLLMTVYTAINLPYSSLAGVMTADSNERTGLNQYRFVFAFAGQLLVSGTALYLVSWLGGGDSAAGYQRTILLFAAVAVVLFAITFATTRERVEPPPAQQSDLLADVRNLVSTRPWLVLFGVGVLSFTLFAMQSAVTAFYFKYYIGDAEGAQPFNVVGTLALIAAIPLARPLAQRFGNRAVFIGCSAATGALYLLMSQCGPDQLSLIYALNVASKIAYAPTVPLLWTMIADSADYSEWRTGRRATGLFFSAATLSMKLGWGIGGGLAGFLLEAFGYVADVDQTESALSGIVLMMTALPGALYLAAGALFFLYDLDRDTARRMADELEARRASQGGEA